MFFMTRTLVTVQNLCFYVIAALKREVQEMRLPLTFGGVLEWWPNPFHVMCVAWLSCSFRLTIQQCSWDWRVCHELQYHPLSEVLCLFSPIFFSPTRNFGFSCKGTNSSGWVFSSVNRTLLEQLCDVYFSADSKHKALNCIIYFMQRISESRWGNWNASMFKTTSHGQCCEFKCEL